MDKPRRGRPKTGSTREALIAKQREEAAVKLRIEGFNLEEIAARIGYAHKESARRAIMRAKARLSPVENIEELRRIELAKCDEVEQEAWEQWHRSTEDATKETVRQSAVQIEGKKGEIIDATKIKRATTREGQSGNPALLEKVLKAMERRAKLLGLDAPERLDLNAGVRVIGQDRTAVLEAALKRLKKKPANANGD